MHPAHAALSRRLTAALCLLLLGGAAWGLQSWTDGFERWTFEAQRQQQLRAGELRAPAVALRGASQPAPVLWHEGASTAAAYLVDFIYTRCPGVCLALGSEYQQMQRQLMAQQRVDPQARPARAGVHLVSVSFDVEHDGPVQMTQLAARLQADPAWWTLAVPATPDAARTLLQGLGVVAVPDGQGGFVHNGAIHLLDEQGRLRGLFEFDEWPQALAAAQQLVASPRQALP